MTALYSVEEIRAIEAAAQAELPPGMLMQRAGLEATQAALWLIQEPHSDAKVLVLAGPGNNGGDALEAAAHLAQGGLQVHVLFCADSLKQSLDAQQALARAQSTSVQFNDPTFLTEIASIRWSLVVDGLFGIGLTRPIEGDLQNLVGTINSLICPILALDVPSGLNADTGTIVGNQGAAIRATHTISFIADKPGLHTCNGRDYAGRVQVAPLEISDKNFPQPHAFLNEITFFAGALQRRIHNTHKGSYGDVAIIGGAHGMTGAPLLAARATANCGAGRVFAAFVEEAPAYDSAQPELMCRLAHDLDFSAAILVVGPGLGTSRAAHDLVARALNTSTALVLDADALNLISMEPSLQHKLKQRCYATVMTPHPLEAARLLATTSAVIQADRLKAARELAQQYRATIILKGSGTVIARPDGLIIINTTGNPALATAGSGDVLAGICGALLAQNWPVWEAALGAVWLHGHAADRLVAQGVGPIGLTASELIATVRSALNCLVNNYGH